MTLFTLCRSLVQPVCGNLSIIFRSRTRLFQGKSGLFANLACATVEKRLCYNFHAIVFVDLWPNLVRFVHENEVHETPRPPSLRIMRSTLKPY